MNNGTDYMLAARGVSLVIMAAAMAIAALVFLRYIVGTSHMPGRVQTDRDTGCEYIVTENGGLAPRMDSTGTRQRGCREATKPTVLL